GERYGRSERHGADGVEVIDLAQVLDALAPRIVVRQLFLPAGDERSLAEAERAGQESRSREVHEAKQRFECAIHRDPDGERVHQLSRLAIRDSITEGCWVARLLSSWAATALQPSNSATQQPTSGASARALSAATRDP